MNQFLTKKEISYLYFDLKLSAAKIAKQKNTSATSVIKLLHFYGLKPRLNRFPTPPTEYKKFKNIKVIGKYSHGAQKYQCECECGNIITTTYQCIFNRKSDGCNKCSKGNFYKEMPGHFWSKMILAAKERKLEFTITKEYIWELFLKQDRKCKFTGLCIYFPKRTTSFTNYTASLDRIDSSKGYIEGNVQWVHKKVNIMKQAMTDIEFINWCSLICNYNKLGVN